MASERELKRQALRACQLRGHSMTRFARVKFDSRPSRISVSRATCRKCRRYIDVNTRPDSNEINIGGDAVALDCR